MREFLKEIEEQTLANADEIGRSPRNRLDLRKAQQRK